MKAILMWPALWYLRFLAKTSLLIHNPPVIIGVAGSVGKSSTRNALHALLREFGKTVVVGNSETGVPLGIMGITPRGYSLIDWLKMLLRAPLGLNYLKNVTYLIVEMGIDDPYPPKNMTYLLTIIQPHIGILVHESATHTYQFEKLLTSKMKSELSESEKLSFLTEKITEEDMKMVLQKNCKVIVYNNDNEFIKKAIGEVDTSSSTLISFGKGDDTEITYQAYSITEKGTILSLKTKNRDTITLTFSYLLPQEYQEIFAAAFAASFSALSPKYTNAEIIKRGTASIVQHFHLPKGRGSIFNGINNSLIIDSTYNASKVAVFAFLDLLERLKKTTKRKAIFVFGDMRELGDGAKSEHTQVAKRIIEVCDVVYCVGPLTKEFVIPHVEKKVKDVRWFSSNIEVGEYLQHSLPDNSLILLKGSQNTIFLEESIKYILATKKDQSQLCRQEPYWLRIKQSQNRIAKL